MQSSSVAAAPRSRRWVTPALTALGLAGLAAALWLIPPEQTLGNVIKVIFLHGALVRVGLLAFAVAGVLSLGFLLTRRTAWFAWAMAAQQGAVILWIVYALTSSISTWLSWGEWIAWDEPRVRASVHVLWFSLACLLLVMWMGNRYFAAIVNLIVTGVAWTCDSRRFDHPPPLRPDRDVWIQHIRSAVLGDGRGRCSCWRGCWCVGCINGRLRE
jgi:hypothetical protein